MHNPSSKECIIVDEQGDKIRLSLPLNLAERFGGMLLPPLTVVIRNFKVGSFVSRYATLSYIKKRVVITEHTSITEIEDFVGPVNGFLFTPFQELTKPRFKANDTVDVIGFVIKREKLNTSNRNGPAKQRVSIELMDPNGKTLRCAFFGDFAVEVHQLFEMPAETKPPTMVIQFAKVNEYQGSLSLTSAYHGTRVLYDTSLPEIDALRTRLVETGVQIPELITIDPRPSRGEVDYLQGAFKDCRLIMLNDLHNHTSVDCYGAYGTVDCLHLEKGWFFTSCRRCNKGIRSNGDSGSVSGVAGDLVCGCVGQRPLLIPKFRLDLTAVDDSGSASLTLFDQDIERLINVTCQEARQRNVSDFVHPEELNTLIGLRLLFKVEVSKFNIEKNHQVYTCKEVTDKVEVIRPFLRKHNIALETLPAADNTLPLIDLTTEEASGSNGNSPLAKRKLIAGDLEAASSISPTKLNKNFEDVATKKE